MARLSPECFAVWRFGRRFVGWNRREAIVWFTTGRVVVADRGREFAFDVTSFGLPVARWVTDLCRPMASIEAGMRTTLERPKVELESSG